MPPNSSPSSYNAENNNNDKITSEIAKTELEKNDTNEYKSGIKWPSVIYLMLVHVLFVHTIITFPYRQHYLLFLSGIFGAMISLFGISAGIHRFWSHRSFKAKLPLRVILAVLYYSCGMNPIYEWARNHRIHHKYSDTDADPHNINRGFWFSHIGWLMVKKHKLVVERGKGIDMTDIYEDRVAQFFDSHYYFWSIMCAFVLPVFIPVYFFNQDLKLSIMAQIFIRYTLVLNATWAVNSLAHSFGYRTYDKAIAPVENTFVSIAIHGEGWHNYHHVFPWDYRSPEHSHGIINLTTILIDAFAKIGWAYDRKFATTEHVRKVVEARGDGTHYLYGK